MAGREDAPSGGGEGSSHGTGGDSLLGMSDSAGGRKMYWRSSSWSSSRTSLPPLNPDSEKDHSNVNGSNNSVGQGRRSAGHLTPRSQNSFKSRACLPPLQPLSIARRSLDEWPKAGSDDIGEWPLAATPSGKDVGNCGERLKLDLSSIQRIPDKNGGLVKREKIAFFDKECSKVAEHVYLGGDAVARDMVILKQHGITHILNCVGFVCPEYFKADFVYRTLWLQDSPSEDITSILYDVFDYFEDVREQGGRVFVHCCQGVSRSTSLVIAYRMWREGQSFDDAFQYVKAARGIADPNMGFACQLLQCQKRVHAFPLSPSSLLRMYRIAPHSPYDPLHLVPKMLNDPSPSALDSRGAFIIHIASAIYVWIGKKCEVIMERDTRGAVCQIVRYEKVHGPIIMIKEGEEPLYFWDAFSSLLPLMDKSINGAASVESSSSVCVGDRKVDAYSVDFEVFHKAAMGGFVPPFAAAETEKETILPARESSWSSLRLKFVSGSMKEFVSTTKSRPSIVYPDSLSVVEGQRTMNESYASANSLLSLASPQLSSPSQSPSSSSLPYLSPDSISSDASFNSATLGESPLVSPSVEDFSSPTSSILPNFSNMMLQPSKPSKLCPQSISKSEKFIDVNFNSESCLKSASAPSKKSCPSIAERRGSMSKSLKLRTTTHETLRAGAPLNSVTNKPNLNSSNDNACSLSKSHDTKNPFECKEDVFANQDTNLPISLGSIDSCTAASRLYSDQYRENNQFGLEDNAVLNAGVDNVSEGCDFSRPIICRWPSLEKVPIFNANDLDSHSVFVFITPSLYKDNTGGRILYFWIGRFFNFDKSKTDLEGNQKFGDLTVVDWKQASSVVISRLGLPKNIHVQIVKEDEEPTEFRSLLSSL